MMEFHLVTLFPELFDSPFRESILKRAQEKGLVSIRVHNLRDYTTDRHRVTDDYPFGGGTGMVMKPEPLVAAIRGLKERFGRAHVVLMDPTGTRLDQKKVRELSTRERLILLCGRYEGVDERVREGFVDEAVSIGDFVTSGGEIPAMLLVEAVARLVPGVVGGESATTDESFENNRLEYPLYTRPRVFEDRPVPEVLLNGNHEAIRRWRNEMSLRRTLERRPDLLRNTEMEEEDLRVLEKIRREREG
jgi:tRNA (guanine37-N1)-methyltransferase